MEQRQDEMRFDGIALAPAHSLDLLGDVLPVDFISGAAAQRLGLLFGPQQDVVLVEVAHRLAPLSRSMSARRNSGSVARCKLRINGPRRRGRTSQRLLPGSHVPPAAFTSGTSSAGQRTVTILPSM